MELGKIIEKMEEMLAISKYNDSVGWNPSADTETLEAAVDLLKAMEPQATTPEAEWLLFKGRQGATCSYCKHTFYDVYDPENYDYYCRHCGAKMVKIRTVKWDG